MDKIWVKDVKEGERVKSRFLVARKATPTAKSGKTYLAVTFHDKTGELEARAFDGIEELAARFEEKDYVDVEGTVGLFQGKPQLRIEGVEKADPAGVEAAEFAFAPPPEPKKPEKTGFSDADEALWKELAAILEAVTDPNVKKLLLSFVEDEEVVQRLRRAPAAKSIHHAYPGGLLEHTVSCLKLAHRLADHYPQVDRDMLVAGAFLHDLGKIRELSFDRQVEYSDEGRLIGHLVMTAQWVHDKARRTGIPRDLEHHLVHLVLGHHGRYEYGSPKLPMTLEALLTHYLDELDSRVNSWLNLMGGEGGTRRWTDSNNVYEQHIWRGTLPTVQVEKKGPPAEVMTPVIYVPREGGRPQGESRRSQQKKKQKDRREQPPREKPAQQPAAAAEPGHAHEAPRPEAAPHRPERPERRDHRAGPGGHGAPGGHPGPGGAGGPGDRRRGYTGPRLPGDKGLQARPGKPGLTHNPFAALAQKVEATEPAHEEPAEASAPAEATAPAEAAPPAPLAEATAPAPQERPQQPAEGSAPAGGEEPATQ
ncbi:MAG TPA: HD domain-containing protein [Anaeromyxobacteraceae bacterium]|jgi:3'-5' exoribonuclease|nr:HD domain-containing protein [Anaeromyxobacteraceae bacterium]